MSSVEAYRYEEEGFQPQVTFGDWQVAHLNWEPIFGWAGWGEIERHVASDEVFVLWKGRAALFVVSAAGVDIHDMETGTIYNVPQGAWHNLIASRDAAWIIVESRGTDIHDTEIRALTPAERAQIQRALPAWTRALVGAPTA